MFATEKIRRFFSHQVQIQPAPIASSHVSIAMPNEDDEDIIVTARPIDAGQEHASDSIGYAEGQSFVIEYMDSRGQRSTRRITVWDIKEGAGGCPLLVAKCHERNAQRSFRIDRIQSVIDFDGVVQEPLAEFFVDTFDMAPHIVRAALSPERASKPRNQSYSHVDERQSSQTEERDRWNAVKTICRRRGVPLLCLVARADAKFHPLELDIVCQFASRCCSSESIVLTDHEQEKLGAYISRLRPTEKAVEKCLDLAAEWGNREILDLLETCARVVKADDRTAPEEMDELSYLVKEVTGLDLFP